MCTVQKVAIVAALEREIRPLVKIWRLCEQDHAGRRFRFYESEYAVLTCGGWLFLQLTGEDSNP